MSTALVVGACTAARCSLGLVLVCFEVSLALLSVPRMNVLPFTPGVLARCPSN